VGPGVGLADGRIEGSTVGINDVGKKLGVTVYNGEYVGVHIVTL